MPSQRLTLPVATLTISLIAGVGAAAAQSSGSAGAAQFQAGYGGSRYTTAQNATGSTRDENGNRLIVNGIIQAGASSSSGYVGAGGNGGTAVSGATAIGNNLNVVVQGNRNTVIVNSTQTNTGDIKAGSALNGSLVFP
ncbi:MAG: holdfast anchoring protein HfaA [Brevundimonas sp.]